METTKEHVNSRIVTLGELCEALADGDLPSTREGGFYVVGGRDLRRYESLLSGESFPLLLDLARFEPVPVVG